MYFAQQSVAITARKNVIKAIKGGDMRASQWWLEKHDFANQVEEPPKMEPEPGVGSVIDRFKAYEQEVLAYQREYPHGVGIA